MNFFSLIRYSDEIAEILVAARLDLLLGLEALVLPMPEDEVGHVLVGFRRGGRRAGAGAADASAAAPAASLLPLFSSVHDPEEERVQVFGPLRAPGWG